MTERIARALALGALVLLAAPRASAQAFHLLRSAEPDGGEPGRLTLGLAFPPTPTLPADFLAGSLALTNVAAEEARAALGVDRRARDTKTAMLTGGTLLASSIYALSSPWGHGFTEFHFHNEHWFEADTYAGGADKVSHFIVTAALARELALAYDSFGHEKTQSTALAFGVTALTGVIVELGDAISPYGFSWEDVTVDVLGAATGLLLTREGLTDLIGLRVGKVGRELEPPPQYMEYLGTGYSTEIYSADLKIAGLAKRTRFDAGPARFLLTSVTYETKGYGFVPPLPKRERLVGIEVGLNLPEILSAAGVPETTWWGSLAYKILNFFRIPFTSFGFRYDLNHHTWHGPDTGNKYY